MRENKAFGLWSAVFLGIGSMGGAGILILKENYEKSFNNVHGK